MTRKQVWVTVGVIAIVVLSVAGAWTYMSHDDSSSNSTPTSSSTNQPPPTDADASPTTKSLTPPSSDGDKVALTLYYVAVGDGGTSGEKFGCDDSLVATYSKPVAFDNQLKATMEMLLTDHSDSHGASGLRNALADSSLTYVSGSKSGDVVTVHLSGTLKVAGECDGPRVQRQLEQTATTAVGAGQAKIFVNNKSLAQALSLRD